MNIDALKNIAHDFYRYAYNNDDRMNDKIIEFYDKGKESPSVSKIIFRQAGHESIERYTQQVIEDINSLNRGNPFELFKDHARKSKGMIEQVTQAGKFEPVKKHFEKFQEAFIKLYPQTAKLREQLILNNRISLDEVTPCLPKGIKKTLKFAKYF